MKKDDVIMNEDITAKRADLTSDSGKNYGIIPISSSF